MERKVIPFMNRRPENPGEPYSKLLTNDEVETILLACIKTGPKTDEELASVLRNCELIKVEETCLKLVLQGKLVIYGTADRTIICGLNKSEKAKEGE
jgi:hypothetical protein